MARKGMQVVGVPIGSSDYQKGFIGGVMRGEPRALVRALVSLDDAPASSQILRRSAAPKLSFLPRTLPPEVTKQTAKKDDKHIE